MKDNLNLLVAEHIVELRKRVIIVVVALVVFTILGLFLSDPLFVYLSENAYQEDLKGFRVQDPLKVYMQLAFIISLICTFPVALYQLWRFVAPGLFSNERKATLSYIPIAIALFLVGLAFSYFILFPFVLNFMLQLSERMGIEPMVGVQEYFTFLFQITLPFGVLFELPVVVLFLTRLGLLTPTLLRKIRKYSYFVLLIIAGLITPPDIFSHMMVTVPLLLLYELSIVISAYALRKKQRSEKANEQTV
ncbi:twin-arginine translocase subunit TatC [Aureibacillus halotolerans]|uniref:Sec-independent protein translocase protein TatC n=1 Tax=Aureibacillus halotolerans TaxID=1508390 RepID=A0A4R6TVE7_9BACI|nr:twin-arginine translocase subunit TatC [Aureibacillus halotolerans]TDQ35226.1 sec-independent protein translocase protein TatC [Aureibacillus halotolerans]